MWEEIVDALNAVNGGAHPGFRAVHAKGTVCSGSFTPTPEVARLSRAAHLQGEKVETTVHFSNASGDPDTSDANPIAGRGMAVKFHLPDGEATDIVAVPLMVFMARTFEIRICVGFREWEGRSADSPDCRGHGWRGVRDTGRSIGRRGCCEPRADRSSEPELRRSGLPDSVGHGGGPSLCRPLGPLRGDHELELSGL